MRSTESEQLNLLAQDPLFRRFLQECAKHLPDENSFAQVVVQRSRNPRLYRQLKQRADALAWRGKMPPYGYYRPTLERRLEQLAEGY